MRIPFTNVHILTRSARGHPTIIAKASQPRGRQTRASWEHNASFNVTGSLPERFNLELYDTIRSTVPLCDAALDWHVDLMGEFTIESEKQPDAAEFLNDALKAVRVGDFDTGWQMFQSQVVDQALHYGRGIGEAIPVVSGKDIHRLVVGDAKAVRFKKRPDGTLALAQDIGLGRVEVLEDDRLVTLYAPSKRNGRPEGYSVLFGLAFVAQAEEQIVNAITHNFWRVGDPTFHIHVSGGTGNEISSPDAEQKWASDLLEAVETEFKEVQKARRGGEVRDLFTAAAGDWKVDISTIGGEILTEFEQPMRVVCEQLIAKLGVPPFMFGLSWSARQTMTSDQSDMLVTKIDARRLAFEPCIRRICDAFLLMTGKTAEYEIVWDDVNLMDETQVAKARRDNAEAEGRAVETALLLAEAGMLDQADAEDWLREREILKGMRVSRALVPGKDPDGRTSADVRKARWATLLLTRGNGNGHGPDPKELSERLEELEALRAK